MRNIEVERFELFINEEPGKAPTPEKLEKFYICNRFLMKLTLF
jgi:hypothetical protein